MRRQGRKGRARAAALSALRPAVLAAFGGRCANPWCRTAGRLDVHHVIKRSQGGTDSLEENLVALCRACHERTDWPKDRGRLVITGPPWTFQLTGQRQPT
jgi:5-methylcytosine-specific restriction endonuclease McrA